MLSLLLQLIKEYWIREIQKDKNNPVWHNHFVSFTKDNQFYNDNLAIQSVTFEQPGDVYIPQGQTA